MKLFFQHFRAERTGLLVWGGLSLLLAYALAAAGSSAAKTGSLVPTLQALPASLQAALGITAGLGPLDSFIAIKVGPITTLVLAMYAALLALSAITREVDRRTIDFVLALPVNRRQVLLARVGVMGVNTAVVGLVTWLTLGTGIAATGLQAPWSRYGLMILGQWLLAVTLGALVLLVSLWVDDYAFGVKLALGAISLGYILEVTLRISGLSRWGRAWSPFSYVDVAGVLRTGALPWADVGILVVVAVLAIGLSLLVFERKQITT